MIDGSRFLLIMHLDSVFYALNEMLLFPSGIRAGFDILCKPKSRDGLCIPSEDREKRR